MKRLDSTVGDVVDEQAELANLVGELTDMFQAGQVVDQKEYLETYPQFAKELLEVWPALEAISGAAENRHTSELPWPVAMGSDPARIAIGDFRIIREVGRGGMGVVYEAEQLSLHRRVALKVLPFAAVLDSRQLDRFKLEAQAAAALHHTNIVPIYSIGCDRAIHFYAMQYVEGPTLAEVIDQLRGSGSPECSPESKLASVETQPVATASTGHSTKKSETVRTMLRLGVQIADGLHHAHERDVIHRDIKPSNLIVDSDQNIWITDFGLARIQSSTQLTMTNDVVGTLRYMSPEQAMAKRAIVDRRSDIYSLGATLYELLTLRPVFDGEDRHELLRQIALDEPRAPCRIEPAIPDDVETILLKAIAKDPDDRYSTAQELRDDLTRFLEHQPVLARRPTVVKRLKKWSWRHRSFVWTASAALVILLSVVAVGATLFAVRINRVQEENQASKNAAEHLAASLSVANGARLAEEGNLLGSLAWFAEALRLDQGKDDHVHRVRLAMAMRGCPKLVYVGESGGDVRRAAVSPDGRRVLTTANNGLIQVWDVATGELVQTMTHGDRIEHVQFSPDGRRIVTACRNGNVQVWECATGHPTSPAIEHNGPVWHAEFSPDSHRIVTAQDGGLIRVWDADSGTQIGADILHETIEKRPMFASFSPDGKRLLTAAFIGSVRVWDASSAEPATSYLKFHGNIVSATFSPDGARVLAVDLGSVRAWDIATAEVVQDITLAKSHPGESALSPDCRYFLSAGYDEGSVQLFDLETGEERANFAPRDGVADVQYCLDGHHVLILTSTGNIFVWDLASGYAAAPRWELQGIVHDLYLDRDEPRVLITREDGSTHILDFQTAARPSCRIAHCRNLRDGAFAADGRSVLTATSDSIARISNATTGQAQGPPLAQQTLPHAVAFSPNGSVVAVASGHQFRKEELHGEVRLWNPTTGELLETLEHRTAVNHVAFNYDGRQLVTATMAPDSGAYVWDLETHRRVTELKHRGTVWSARFSFDDRLVATASDDHTARIWHGQTGAPVTPPLKHDGPVLDVTFSPDNRFIATASKDNTARVWDVGTGLPVSPPLRHSLRVERCWFDPTGKHLFSALPAGMLHRWDLSPDQRPVDDLFHSVRLLAESVNQSTSGLKFPSHTDLSQEFLALRSRYPDYFSSSREEVRSWYFYEAITYLLNC